MAVEFDKMLKDDFKILGELFKGIETLDKDFKQLLNSLGNLEAIKPEVGEDVQKKSKEIQQYIKDMAEMKDYVEIIKDMNVLVTSLNKNIMDTKKNLENMEKQV
jgi:uncharacterized protein YoxC